eukprot:sb/3475887/
MREGDVEKDVELSEVSVVEAKYNNVFCYTGAGEGYVGTADTTKYGVKCMNWNDVPSMPDYSESCSSFNSLVPPMPKSTWVLFVNVKTLGTVNYFPKPRDTIPGIGIQFTCSTWLLVSKQSIK